MAPEERNKFGAPMFEPEVFQKQMYYFEISAHDNVVTFWPRSDSAPGRLCHLDTPRYVSGVMQ